MTPHGATSSAPFLYIVCTELFYFWAGHVITFFAPFPQSRGMSVSLARLCMMACFSGAPLDASSEHQMPQSLHIDRELGRFRNTSPFLIWIDVGL